MSLTRAPLPALLLAAALGASGCPLSPVAPTPEPPILAPPTSPTNELVQVIAGTKPAGTAILVNRRLVLPVDGETTFTTPLTLQEGLNEISVAAVDGAGNMSSAVTVSILVDTTPPPAPTIDPVETRTLADRIVLTGSAEEGSDVLVGGAPAELTSLVTWRAELDLAFGANEIRVTARDALGNESDAASVVVVREPFHFEVDPVPGHVSTSVVQVTGTRGPGIAVLLRRGSDETVVVGAEDPGDSWTTDVALAEGENRFSVVGDHEQRTETVDLVVVYDIEPPASPVLDPLPALSTSPEVTVSGVKEAGSGVEVNGALLAPIDDTTAFSLVAPLAPGNSSLEVVAVDAAGNRSLPVDPAPVVYFDPLGIYLSVDPAPAVVAAADLVLSGRRAANADVTVAGTLVPADGTTSWQAQVTLSPGANDLLIEAVVGGARRGVTVSVTYLDQPPSPPSLSAPALTSTSPVTVTGSKPAGTAVLRADGSPVTLLDDQVSFVDVVEVSEGQTILSYRTRDGFGRTSALASVDVTLDLTPPTASIASPLAGAVVGASLSVRGTANDGIGVASVAVCLGACLADTDYVAASGDAPFDALLDTTSLPASLDGTLVDLHLRVIDAAGNRLDDALPVMLMRRPLALSLAPAFDAASAAVDVAAGPARELAVVFSHPAGGGGSDVYATLEDGLSYAAAALLLSDGAEYGFAAEPVVARSASGAVHALWADDGSAGSGVAGAPGLVHRAIVTGVPAAPLTVQALAGVSVPDVTSTPTGLAAVWRREQTSGVQDYVIELSLYDGAAWSVPVAVATDGDGTSVAPGPPRVAVSDDGLVHIVWSDAGALDGVADDRDVYYRSYDPQLDVLGAPTLVSDDGANLSDGESTRPSVAAVGADPAHRVAIAWIETGAVDGAGAGLSKAVLRDVDDNGLGAVLDASLVPGRQDTDEVDVALDPAGVGAVVFVARGGDVAGSGADADVFLRRYDGALGALAPGLIPVSDATADTVSVGESSLCRVALDGLGDLHVVWVEASDLDGTIAGPADADVMTLAIGPEAP